MNYADALELKDIIRYALKEDIGRRDITTELVIAPAKSVKAILLVKEPCVVCGMEIARLVFKTKDNKIQFKPLVKDGQVIKKGKIIARIQGRASSILTAERVALNFLGFLSGTATKTRNYVNAVKPYKAKILDTRKTIPGLRQLQKYAVRIGGGYNHRLRLDEMVLIKDNHLKVTKTYQRLPKLTKGYKIEVEVKNLREFKEALKLKPDIIMLDNMRIKDMKKAVQRRNQLSTINYQLRTKLEASGGINLKNVKKIASCGVETISVGDLTHSVKSADISLEVL